MINIGSETEQIEFKKSTGEIKEGVISIVSILNKHSSGVLYFGVKNNGDVLGQVINDETLREVSQAIRNHITPAIFPTISKKEFLDEDKTRAVVCVEFSGNQQPYLAYNIPRIRQSDEDIIMSQELYGEKLLARGGERYSWESLVSEYTIDDIVMADFNMYLAKAKSVHRIEFESEDPKTVLDKIEVLASDGVHLLNAGAALFCSSSYTDVQMAKFATDVKATFTDIRREDHGSIVGLSKKCEQYIIDAMDWKADIIGLERVETPEIPVEAIREAVVNSFGHRLYNNNQCNEIDVFKDRIEIHTTGGFPQGHTPDEFIDGKKKAIRRNKLITRVLYYSKDMETFATGLKRIKELCDEAGCKVEFRAEKDDFVVCFYRNLREAWNGNHPVDHPVNHPVDHPVDHPENHAALESKLKSIEADFDTLVRIVEFCHMPHSTKEIIEHLNKSDRRSLRNHYLNPLVEGGILKLTLPDNLHSSKQKYIVSDEYM